MSVCHSAGVDYTDPRSLSGGGVVEFDHALGLLSTCLHIPLLPDNITEGTEYFGLSFVPLIHNGDRMLITPVDPIQIIVAINDTNGEYNKHTPTHVCIIMYICIMCRCG